MVFWLGPCGFYCIRDAGRTLGQGNIQWVPQDALVVFWLGPCGFYCIRDAGRGPSNITGTIYHQSKRFESKCDKQEFSMLITVVQCADNCYNLIQIRYMWSKVLDHHSLKQKMQVYVCICCRSLLSEHKSLEVLLILTTLHKTSLFISGSPPPPHPSLLIMASNRG